MARKETGRPPRRTASPKKFEENNHEQGEAQRHKRGRDHITRPMGAQVNARITDCRGDEKIEPTPPAKKQGANRRDDHVDRFVPRRKGGPGTGAVAFIGKTNGGLLKEGHKFGASSLQLNHPDSLNLLWSPAINRALQGADEQLFGNEEE